MGRVESVWGRWSQYRVGGVSMGSTHCGCGQYIVGFYRISHCIAICFRASPKFNKEVYVDFVAVQIKFLSFVAYIIRIYQVNRQCTYCSYIVHVSSNNGHFNTAQACTEPLTQLMPCISY